MEEEEAAEEMEAGETEKDGRSGKGGGGGTTQGRAGVFASPSPSRALVMDQAAKNMIQRVVASFCLRVYSYFVRENQTRVRDVITRKVS